MGEMALAEVHLSKEIVHFKPGVDKARVSAQTIRYLEEFAKKAKISRILITSATRTKEEQAKSMYLKVAQGDIDSYLPPGQAVQRVAVKGINAGEARSTILQAMVAEIDKQGYVNVSQHAGVYGLNVVDISIKHMAATDQERLKKVIRQYLGCPVYKFGYPDGPKPGTKYEFLDHRCFHIAIMQVEELAKKATVA